MEENKKELKIMVVPKGGDKIIEILRENKIELIKLLQDIVSDEIKSIRYLNNNQEMLSVVIDYIDDNSEEVINFDNVDVSDYDKGYAQGRWDTQVEMVRRLGLYRLSGKEVAEIVGLIYEPVDIDKEE